MTKFVKANDKELTELIEDVTLENSENLRSFAKICDIISSSPDGPKEAVKCFKKRLATKNPAIVKATLLLLDSCIKDCGMKFHIQIFNRDFLQVFLKVIKPKNNPTMEIQASVLGLIQKWAISFQGIQELKEICRTYEDLMNRNVEFPPRDPEQASQIYIMSSGNPISLGVQSGDRRESVRSIGIMEPDSCMVYEVDPSSATLCPTGTARQRGHSAEPRFPHKNTLNPCGGGAGRSPSRDRSPGPGGRRRSSYALTLGDNDLRVAGMRKQSYVVVSNDHVYGQERKQSCIGVPYGQDRKQSCIGVPHGQERKQSYVGGALGQERKQSGTGSSGRQTPVIICVPERKQSHVGNTGGQAPAIVTRLQSELSSIRQNCQFFSELLSTMKPGKESASDKELLQEYNLTCLDMKKRVVQLLETPEGEKSSDELLSLNDELNIALFQYQKYSRSAALLERGSLAPPKGNQEPVIIKVNDGEINTLINIKSDGSSSKDSNSNVKGFSLAGVKSGDQENY